MLTEYKGIKIPKDDYDSLEKARQLLARKGLDKLPKDFRKLSNCPICGSEIEGLMVEYQHLRCSNPDCRYTQRNVEIDAAGTFAFGALVGLGVAALVYLLCKSD